MQTEEIRLSSLAESTRSSPSSKEKPRVIDTMDLEGWTESSRKLRESSRRSELSVVRHAKKRITQQERQCFKGFSKKRERS